MTFDDKGQGSVFAFFSLILGLIVIVAFLPLIADVVTTGINTLNSAPATTSLAYNSFTILLLSSIVLIGVILYIMSLVGEFSRPRF